MTYYRLDENHEIHPFTDPRELEQVLKDPSRIIGSTHLEEYLISTVFLGIDHNFFGSGPPLLFETMIFGPPDDDELYQTRCCTYAEALEMHKRGIKHAKGLLK